MIPDKPIATQLRFSVMHDVIMSLLYLANFIAHLLLSLYLYSEIDSFSGRICLIFLLFPFIFATGLYILFICDMLNNTVRYTYDDVLTMTKIDRTNGCIRKKTLTAIFVVYPMWLLAYICQVLHPFIGVARQWLIGVPISFKREALNPSSYVLGRFAPLVIDAFTRAIPAIWMAVNARNQGLDSARLTATLALNSFLLFMQMLMMIYCIVRICAGGTFSNGFLKLAKDLNYIKYGEADGKVKDKPTN